MAPSRNDVADNESSSDSDTRVILVADSLLMIFQQPEQNDQEGQQPEKQQTYHMRN